VAWKPRYQLPALGLRPRSTPSENGTKPNRPPSGPVTTLSDQAVAASPELGDGGLPQSGPDPMRDHSHA